jgi:4-alpha-glucanotransferase
VYTGTHDNDTTVGWFLKTVETNPSAAKELKKYFKVQEQAGEKDICWKLIETAFGSKSSTAIIPIQDILCLGSEARMNIPNTIGGNNWRWRLEKGLLTEPIEKKLAVLSVRYNR